MRPILLGVSATPCDIIRSLPVVQIAETPRPYDPGVASPTDADLSRFDGRASGLDELRRLEAQLVMARRRLQAVQADVAQAEAASRAAMRDEVESVRRRIANIERSHADALQLVENDAARAIERLRHPSVDRRDGSAR